MKDAEPGPNSQLHPAQGAPPNAFSIEGWRILPHLNRMIRNGKSQPVENKAMEVLVHLSAHPDRVVTREELLESIWPGVFVSEEALSRCISLLRKKFRDPPAQPRVIQTIRGVGYRLIAPVVLHEANRAVHCATTGERFQERSWRRGIGWWAGGILALLSFAFLGWMLKERAEPLSESPMSWRPLTAQPGSEVEAAWSPDGSRLAYSQSIPDRGANNLMLLVPGTGSTLQLTEGETVDRCPTWSPDGRLIAFLRFGEQGADLKTVGSLGGMPRQVVHLEHVLAAGMSWSPDGMIAVTARPSPGESFRIRLVDPETGEIADLTHPTNQHWGDYGPKFSPDGRLLAFTRGINPGIHELFTIEPDSGIETQVTRDARRVMGHAWTRDGRHLVYGSSRSVPEGLWCIPRGGGPSRWIGGSGRHPDLSRSTGTIAVERWQYDRGMFQISMDEPESPGQFFPGLNSTLEDRDGQFHPDGDRIVFVSNRGGDDALWLYRRSDRSLRQLTQFGGIHLSGPKWSPNGETIAFTAYTLGGSADLYTLDAEGGEPEPRTRSPWNEVAPSWSPDGHRLVIGANRTGRWQIRELDCRTGTERQLTRHGGYAAQFSPDGGSLYFTKFEAPGIWRMDLPNGEETRTVEQVHLLDWGNWLVADHGIYYLERPKISTSPNLMFLDFGNGAKRMLVQNLHPNTDRTSLSLHPDRKHLLVSRIFRQSADLYLLQTDAQIRF